MSGSNAKIEGNFIGTDPSGTIDRGNGSNGITNNFGSSNDQIGGTTSAARNLISGNNGAGVTIGNLGGEDNKVEGNLIGTKANGTEALGNNFQGVSIVGPNNFVGGDEPAAENVIANNGLDGVRVGSASNNVGNRILRNSIFDNVRRGINLVGGTETNDVTDNDLPKDADTGPNNLQNFPELTSATLSGGQITIEGLLNSRPRKKFTIRFFSSPAADVDPTGFGEGKTFIGQTTVKTNRKGKRSFDFTFTPEQAVSVGDVITATATNNKTGDTSEFTEAVTVS